MSAIHHLCSYRVLPGETDARGINYNCWPVQWFEFARTEVLKKMRLSHALLEQRGIKLMLAEATNRYQGRACIGDPLEISVHLEMCAETMLCFNVTVRHAANGDPVSEGSTIHSIVGLNGQPIPPPDWLRRKMQQYHGVRKKRGISTIKNVSRKKISSAL